ncbi:hypothetical protein AMTR_s00054p00153030 [Amborella trichopoda]|uniref:Uncharacterized protein n=1 Tax=Amborella trichopoda TaxID=13333 RepID=U5CXV4_AMBTC|nr:hypothetical protein AMTR_s00054p00153030 [Amborella trichopoda]
MMIQAEDDRKRRRDKVSANPSIAYGATGNLPWMGLVLVISISGIPQLSVACSRMTHTAIMGDHKAAMT